VTSAALVDESTYATAQKLAQLATTPEEQPYAQSALSIDDFHLHVRMHRADGTDAPF
jgi:hypothetical protein